MDKTFVIALGGNMILRAKEKGSAEEQYENLRRTADQLLDLLKSRDRIVITHGNGPQVGNGWVSLTLRVDEEVKQTFGSQGLLYDKLLAIRIRGSISLSPITFRKMPEEMLVEKSDKKEEHLPPARPG